MQAVAKPSEGLDFLKYWLILRRRWLPAGGVALAVFIFLSVNIFKKPNTYQSTGQLRFNLTQDSPKIDGIQDYTSESEVELATEIITLSSHEFLSSVVKQSPQFLSVKNKLDAENLQDGLKISPVEDTNIVEISFNSLDPELAALVVNRLMQVYVRSNLQSNRAKAKATREFIAGQLPQVRQQVFVADSTLRRFKETYKVVDLAATKAEVAPSQAKIQDQLSAVDVELTDVSSQITALRRQLGVDAQQALTASDVGQSPAVQEVLKSKESVEQQLREARGRLAPGHPAILDLQDRQQELQVLLQERLKASNGQGVAIREPLFVGATRQGLVDSLLKYELTQTGLVQKRQLLAGQKTAYANQIKIIPGLEQRQRELERELAASESTYNSLLKSLQDIQITENQTIPTVKIVDPALVPMAPSGPNRMTELIRSAIAALLLGAAVAYLLELTDRKLKTVDSIQEAYLYPLLGNIPMFEVGGEVYRKVPVFAEPHSMVSEAYRMLQANLKFLRSDDNPVRIITVTSAQPGEGKSVTTANLAAVLSQMGHQVLLIDTDLRQPTMHQIWEISNMFGLSNVLKASKDKSFTDLRLHIINENLQVLTAGPIPPNPLALIDSQRMSDFLKDQIQKFDYILLDTPPLTVAADPLVVSRFTDGILLVARPEILDKGSAKIANSTLRQSGSTVLGVVANGITLINESYSAYYYAKNNDEDMNMKNASSHTPDIDEIKIQKEELDGKSKY